jgi:hypothetical protein
MPVPTPPTGVELDLLVLGARQRLQALTRGAGLLLLSCVLVPCGLALVVMGAGELATGDGTVAAVTLAAGLLSALGGWLGFRRARRLLGRAFAMRHTLERARVEYERAVFELQRRRT